MTDSVTVKLGEHDIVVTEQRHSRLKRDLAKLVARVPELGLELSDLGDMEDLGAIAKVVCDAGSDFTYDVLAMLIPQFTRTIPRYEFEGYASQEKMDLDEYDPAFAKDPSVPELIEAVKAGINVNGLDFLGKAIAGGGLGGLLKMLNGS